jgi:FkbM family methyltransferase
LFYVCTVVIISETIYYPNNMNVVQNCRHGKMLFSDHDAYVGRSLSLYGEYSETETKLLVHAVKEGGIVVEAGANIGSLTVPLAQKVGRAGMVYAFEPQRTTYYALCGNVFVNNLKNTFCFQRALGNATTLVMIPDIDYDFAGNYGAYSLHQDTGFDRVPNKVPVEMNRLDDFGLPGCDLLKVDVEGMEIEVLKGAENLIRANKPVMYVENDRLESRNELYAWITAQGYECWQHFPRLYSENNYHGGINPNVFGDCISANLLCIHKDSALKKEDFSSFELLPGDVKIVITN